MPSTRRPWTAIGGWAALFPIIGLSLIGAGIRLAIALSDPVWLDELHTVWSTGSTLDQVASRAAAGNQGPMYFWLAWLLRQLLEWLPELSAGLGLRWISLVAGCASLGVAVLIVKRWTGSWLASCCTAWLIAIDPTLIFYATEARPYALLQTLGLIQALWFWHWLTRFEFLFSLASPRPARTASPVWHWSDLGLIATTGLLISTHVTALGLPLVEAVLLLGLSIRQIVVRGHSAELGRVWLSAALLGGLTAILLSPLLPDAQQVLEKRDNWEPISLRVQLISDFDLPLRWGVLLPCIVLGMVVISHSRRRTQESATRDLDRIHNQKLAQLWFAGLWGVMPVVALWSLDFAGIVPAANSRYAQIGTIAIPTFSGLVVGWIARPGKRPLIAIALALALVFSGFLINPWLGSLSRGAIPQLRWEDWGSPIAEINRSKQADPQPVLLFSNLIEDRTAQQNGNEDFQRYLRFPVRTEPQLELGDDWILVYPTLEFQGLSAVDLQQIEQSQGVWVLIRGREALVNEIATALMKQLTAPQLTAPPIEKGSEARTWAMQEAHFSQSHWNDVRLLRFQKQVADDR